MTTWLNNLRSILESKPVVIIYGNVRDKYIDENFNIYSNLTGIIKSLTTSNSNSIQFINKVFNDPSSLASNIEDEPPTEEKDQNQSDKGQPDVTTNPTKRKTVITPSRMFAKWRKILSNPNQNTLAVLYYLDKLVSYKNSYNEIEMDILLELEKVIENITDNNRLILVALQDSQIPIELYTHAPKVRLVMIPLPQQKERKAYIESRLQSFREHSKLISDLSDGLYLRDLDPIIAALPEGASTGEIRKIINKYRLGEKEDYWGSLSTKSIIDALKTFKNTYGVKGQDEAIQRVVDMLAVAKAGLSGIGSDIKTKSKGVLFFAGPSGVGKTFLAQKLAYFLFNSDDAFIRFDMSEFNEEHSGSKLIGSPPGYVGFEQGGKLTNAVRSKPFSVILFDELEKAHPKVLDIFLQVLDAGRLTDGRGQTVFFTEAVIIFTSNIGTRTENRYKKSLNEWKDLEKIKHSGNSSSEIQKQVGEHFRQCVEHFFEIEISRPELLNRIGFNIVPFNYIIGKDIQREIVMSQLNKIEKDYKETYIDHNLEVMFDKSIIDYIVDKCSEKIDKFGGKAIGNLIQEQIMPGLAKRTLIAIENNTHKSFIVRMDVDGNLTIKSNNIPASDFSKA